MITKDVVGNLMRSKSKRRRRIGKPKRKLKGGGEELRIR